MKWIILPLCLVLLQCNNSTNSNRTDTSFQDTLNRQKKSDDTIINVTNISSEISLPGYIEKEYFLITNGDTSNYSCVLSLNEEKESISMNYVYKPFQKYNSLFLPEDSAPVVTSDKMEKFSKHEANYKEQVREIQLILEVASKEFDLGKLRKFRIGMTSIDSLSTTITNLYIAKFGNSAKKINNNEVSEIIRSSKLTYDLNNILSIYNVQIGEIYTDGLMCCIVKNANMQGKKERLHSREFKNWIFDGLVVFALSNVN